MSEAFFPPKTRAIRGVCSIDTAYQDQNPDWAGENPHQRLPAIDPEVWLATRFFSGCVLVKFVDSLMSSVRLKS